MRDFALLPGVRLTREPCQSAINLEGISIDNFAADPLGEFDGEL
jgi:hypothetical protein